MYICLCGAAVCFSFRAGSSGLKFACSPHEGRLCFQPFGMFDFEPFSSVVHAQSFAGCFASNERVLANSPPWAISGRDSYRGLFVGVIRGSPFLCLFFRFALLAAGRCKQPWRLCAAGAVLCRRGSLLSFWIGGSEVMSYDCRVIPKLVT